MTSRILIVDDRPENLLAAKAVLEPLQKEIVCVRSGAEALGALLKDEFAVVLLDVEMPQLDGIATAELIRARPRHQHLPIIFVTAHNSQMERVLRGYQLGAIDFLSKPLVPEILQAKVGFFVELYERGERLRHQERELAERRQSEEESRRAAILEKQLVGIVGHDIRSPLSAILATAQVQLRKGTDLADDQRRAFERIERSTQRIRQIVELLLDFTRARVGRGIPLQRSEVNLPDVCRRIVEEATAVHPGRRIHLACDQRLVGQWDEGRLAQVISNLVDNAIKYSPVDSPVLVSLREAADAAILEVHNGGEPIPQEKLTGLFEPYVRGDERDSSDQDGLGLGLFIVQQIIRGHGGEVEVASDPSGTTFRVVLPRGQQSSVPASAAR